MWNKKSTAVVLAGLLIFALLVSGGCLGGSDSNSYKKAAVLGEVAADDIATLKEKNIELVPYSKKNLTDHRLLFTVNVAKLTDEQKAEIKAMFAEKKEAAVVLYNPETVEEIEALKELLLGAEKDKAILNGENLLIDKQTGKKLEDAKLRFYTIQKDAKGNVHTYAGIMFGLKCSAYAALRNDNIRQEDIDAGYAWLRYNKDDNSVYDVLTYERVPETVTKQQEGTEPKVETLYYNVKEIVKGQVSESDITIGSDNITVNFGGKTLSCLSVEKPKELYLLSREGIELEIGEATKVEMLAGDAEKPEMLSEKERIAKARALGIRNFVDWLGKNKAIKEETLATAGYIKPKTRFEKFVAWVKDIVGSTGIAFADSLGKDLFAVAVCNTAYLNYVDTIYTGFSMDIHTSVVSVHEFNGTAYDGGNDIYFITERCTFTNSVINPEQRHWKEDGSYWGKIGEPIGQGHKYYPNGADCEEGYMGRYDIITQLNGTDPTCKCLWARPIAKNTDNEVEVSSGQELGLGAECGTEDEALKAGVSLDAGFSHEDGETYSSRDIEPSQSEQSSSKGKVTISQVVTKTPVRSNPTWTLSQSAELAKSTFAPVNKIVWKLPTSTRNQYKSFYVNVSGDMCGAYSHNSGTKYPEYFAARRTSENCTINFSTPPLFCLSKAVVNFDYGTAATDYVTVFSQGEWEWNKKDLPDWLEVTWQSANKQLRIYAKQNGTGKTRQCDIVLKRKPKEGEKYGNYTERFDVRAITVTQSPAR